MSKKEKLANSKENIFLVINLVLALVTMALVAALTGRLMAEDLNQSSLFLGLTILSQVAFQCLLFIIKEKKKDKIRAIIVGIIYVAAMIIAFMAKNNHMLFFWATALIYFATAVNQFLLISKERTKKGIITNILLGVLLTLISLLILLDMFYEDVDQETKYITLMAVILFLFSSFRKIIFPSLKFEKMRLLLNILVKTHTFDVLICLISFMIAFSFVLPMFEENITNFWDAMWYCFTVITTIGFGDFVATSNVGRILTVILGIYGIVVVAILTSVIVNFYNEVSAKEKARDIIE